MDIVVRRRGLDPVYYFQEGVANRPCFELPMENVAMIGVWVWSSRDVSLLWINRSVHYRVVKCKAGKLYKVQLVMLSRELAFTGLVLSMEPNPGLGLHGTLFIQSVKVVRTTRPILVVIDQVKEWMAADRPDLDFFNSDRVHLSDWESGGIVDTRGLTCPPAGSTCSVCLGQPAVVLYEPCGHLTVCAQCDRELQLRVTTCALCKTQIEFRSRCFVSRRLPDPGCQEGGLKSCPTCFVVRLLGVTSSTTANTECQTCHKAAPETILQPCLHLYRCKECRRRSPSQSPAGCPTCGTEPFFEVEVFFN